MLVNDKSHNLGDKQLVNGGGWLLMCKRPKISNFAIFGTIKWLNNSKNNNYRQQHNIYMFTNIQHNK